MRISDWSSDVCSSDLGWFAENLDAAGRERMWWNGIEEMERLHRIDWRAFPFLAPGLAEAPTAVFYLETFVATWFDWAAQGRSFPAIEDELRFLIANPQPPQTYAIVWNDARPGPTILPFSTGDGTSTT